MTVTLSNLNSVASSARVMEVLALPASSFSRRKVVSFVNTPSCPKQYHINYIHIFSKPRTVPFSLVTNVPSSNRFSLSSYTYNDFTSSVEEEDYDSNHVNNNADVFADKFTMMKPSVARKFVSRNNNFVNMLSRILASLLSCGLLFACTITVHTLFARNSALAASYDRMGGSLSSSSLTSSPSVHINMVSPHSLQLGPSLAFTILVNLYSILKPLLNQLIMSHRQGSLIFFQVAVSDKKRVLRRKLTRIAKYADTSTLKGLNYVLKEVVNALHQCNDSSFHFTNLLTQNYIMGNLRKCFQELLDRELKTHGRHENSLVNVDGNVKYNKDSVVQANSGIENEYTVVTVMVLATSEHLIPSFKENGKWYHDSIEVLQTLKRIPENEIQSVEVLWSPQKKR